MGFIAKKFSFNRVPCEEYGLRIFDIDGEAEIPNQGFLLISHNINESFLK